MARHEADREDLMREAVALTQRTELRVPGFDDLITIGFRANGAMSVFVGQDPVYQFDPEGRLRRAYAGDFLYRSQHQTLARLQRVRTAEQTQLLRYDLNELEQILFKDAMRSTLKSILGELRQQSVEVVRCVPEAVNLAASIQKALDLVLTCDRWLSVEINRRA